MFNNIKIGVKDDREHSACLYSYGERYSWLSVKVRMNSLHKLDSIYRQYIGAIREIGDLKASLEKMEGYLYHYIAVPSARNNTLASIKQETNSIDQIIQTYKGKELAPEEKKILSDFDCRLVRDAARL